MLVSYWNLFSNKLLTENVTVNENSNQPTNNIGNASESKFQLKTFEENVDIKLSFK